ncbi:hypothetical protein Tco_0586807 [Tanacetum coccineum]
MAEEQVQTNMALMAFSDSKVYTNKTCCLKNYETLKKQCDGLLVKLNESEFKAITYKRGLATLEDQIITYKKNEVLFSEEIGVLKREVACKDYEINMLKSEFEKVKQEKEGIEFKIEKFDKASKDLDQLLGSQITDKCKKGLGYSTVPPPHPLIYNRLNKLEFKVYGPKDSGPKDSEQEPNVINCDNHQRKGIVSRSNYSRVDAKTTHPSVQRNMSLKAVLLKTGLTLLNTFRPVNTTHPKTAVHIAKSKTHFSKQAQSTAKRPFYKFGDLPNLMVHHLLLKDTTTLMHEADPSKPQHDDKEFVDSGCSRHMTGNIAYLSDFKEFDGGYVAFRGGAYGGRITGKGTLKTNSLDFEDVYFVNELKFNLFSVSQMCEYESRLDTKVLVLNKLELQRSFRFSQNLLIDKTVKECTLHILLVKLKLVRKHKLKSVLMDSKSKLRLHMVPP